MRCMAGRGRWCKLASVLRHTLPALAQQVSRSEDGDGDGSEYTPNPEDLEANFAPCFGFVWPVVLFRLLLHAHSLTYIHTHGRNWSVYSHEAPTLWSQCQGSFPWTRGFTCGLWLLMHSMVSNMRSGFSEKIAVRARTEKKEHTHNHDVDPSPLRCSHVLLLQFPDDSLHDWSLFRLRGVSRPLPTSHWRL